jgi:hypothetical protein
MALTTCPQGRARRDAVTIRGPVFDDCAPGIFGLLDLTAIASNSFRDSRSSRLVLLNSNVAMVGATQTVETTARIARRLNIYPVPLLEGPSGYHDDPAVMTNGSAGEAGRPWRQMTREATVTSFIWCPARRSCWKVNLMISNAAIYCAQVIEDIVVVG